MWWCLFPLNGCQMCFATWAYRLTFSILVWATTAIITPPPSSLSLAHTKYTKQFFLNAPSGIWVQFGSGKSTGSGVVVSGESGSSVSVVILLVLVKLTILKGLVLMRRYAVNQA